jgi:hypothetical protein
MPPAPAGVCSVPYTTPAMLTSGAWFAGLLGAALLAFWGGRRLGRCPVVLTATVAAIALTVVVVATTFRYRPTLLPMIVGLDTAVWLEGIVAVFPWMVFVGVLHTNLHTVRLRRAAVLMFVLGIVYFLFGAIWMILPTIRMVGGENRGPDGAAIVTIQNRPDTCVPSSSATALRLMGVPASEQLMCEVVLAKPTRGSTLTRAAWGLRDHLEKSGMAVELHDLMPSEIAAVASPDAPVLVVIRSNIAADHMVVVLGTLETVLRHELSYGGGLVLQRAPLGAVMGATAAPLAAPAAVLVANPSPGVHGGIAPLPAGLEHGLELYAPEDFAKLCRRGAIVFRRLAPPQQPE